MRKKNIEKKSFVNIKMIIFAAVNVRDEAENREKSRHEFFKHIKNEKKDKEKKCFAIRKKSKFNV